MPELWPEPEQQPGLGCIVEPELGPGRQFEPEPGLELDPGQQFERQPEPELWLERQLGSEQQPGIEGIAVSLAELGKCRTVDPECTGGRC